MFARRVALVSQSQIPAVSLMELSGRSSPPRLQRAFHPDPEAPRAGSLSAEHLGGITSGPPPASAYRAPGEATPPPSGKAPSIRWQPPGLSHQGSPLPPTPSVEAEYNSHPSSPFVKGRGGGWAAIQLVLISPSQPSQARHKRPRSAPIATLVFPPVIF